MYTKHDTNTNKKNYKKIRHMVTKLKNSNGALYCIPQKNTCFYSLLDKRDMRTVICRRCS